MLEQNQDLKKIAKNYVELQNVSERNLDKLQNELMNGKEKLLKLEEKYREFKKLQSTEPSDTAGSVSQQAKAA